MSTISEVNTGIKFYGMDVVDYTLSSLEGKVIDYETLLGKVAIERNDKLVAEVEQYSAAVKARQTIVDTLGKAMALANFITTDLNTEKDYEKKHEYSFTEGTEHYNDLEAFQSVKKYTGVELTYEFVRYDGETKSYVYKFSRENILKDQNKIQYLLDMQNNYLQQDMVAIQSLFNKQSDAFTTAKKLTQKVSDTRKNTIQGIG